MDNSPVFSNAQNFGDEEYEFACNFDKAFPISTNSYIDPMLRTTLPPYSSLPAESHFLTPPTTAAPSGSTYDYFGNHSTMQYGTNVSGHHTPLDSQTLFYLQRTAQETLPQVSAMSNIPGQVSPMYEPVSYPPFVSEPLQSQRMAELLDQNGGFVPAAPFSDASSGASDTNAFQSLENPSPVPKRRPGRPATKPADTQRSRNLERNRIAASKCRQKKKEWVSDLESTMTQLEITRNLLKQEVLDLQAHVAYLKDVVMSHANCGDVHINTWVKNHANRYVVRKTGRRVKQQDSDDNDTQTDYTMKTEGSVKAEEYGQQPEFQPENGNQFVTGPQNAQFEQPYSSSPTYARRPNLPTPVESDDNYDADNAGSVNFEDFVTDQFLVTSPPPWSES